jgi:hypothetical protein
VELDSGYVVWLQLYPDVGELYYNGARVHEKEIQTTASDLGDGSPGVATWWTPSPFSARKRA